MKRAVAWIRAKWSEQRAPEVMAAYRVIFVENRSGRLVLADLAKFCHVATSSLQGESDRDVFANEGARLVYLHICEMAGLAPEDFPRLMREYGDPSTGSG